MGAATAALVLAGAVSPVGAGDMSLSLVNPASTLNASPVSAGSGALTDVSAQKKQRQRRAVRRNRGPSAEGMAFMGLAAGLIGSAIAESQRRDYYDSYYGPRRYYRGGYYGGPGYGYYGGGGYYGGPRYYGY